MYVRRHLFFTDRDILKKLEDIYNGIKLAKMRSLYLSLCEIIDESKGGETISLELVSKKSGLSLEFSRDNLVVFEEMNVIDIKY